MKGTMVGIAPPNIEELRRQMGEAARVQAAGAPAAGAPAASAPAPTGTPAAAASTPAAASMAASSKLKGTMIGVAPPSVEDIKKAQDAAQARASAGPAPAAAGSAAPAASSKLKGTMIGVAPPSAADLQKAVADAKAAAQTAAPAVPPGTAAPMGAEPTGPLIGGATMIAGTGSQPPPPNPQLVDAPPSSVNPLGGTVVGTSPFHSPEGQAAAAQFARHQAETDPAPPFEPRPFDASDRTPAGDTAPTQAMPASYPPPARTSDRPGSSDSLAPPPPYRAAGVPAKNNGPLLLLIALVVAVVLIGIALLV